MDNTTVNELVADTRDFFKIEIIGENGTFTNEYCLNMDQSLNNYNSETEEYDYTIEIDFMKDTNSIEEFKSFMKDIGSIKSINLYRKIYDKKSKSYKYSDAIIQLSTDTFILGNVSCRIDPLFDGYYKYHMILKSEV